MFGGTDSDGDCHQLINNVSGFKKLTKRLHSDSHCVMEATGYEKYQLANYLLENNIAVSVENTLVVKHFTKKSLMIG